MSSKRGSQNYKRTLVHLALLGAIAFSSCNLCLAQHSAQLRRVFPVSIAEPVTLDIHLLEGNLQVAYAHEGEVSIVAQFESSNENKASADFLSDFLVVNADGNKIEIGQRPLEAKLGPNFTISYRIGVPYRTEVRSALSSGKQTITGVMGPVNAHADRGDIKVSYVAKAVSAQTGTGRLLLEVIGGPATVAASVGNISCVRVAQGVNAETGDGDISLLLVGPSEAKVSRGTGRIDVGGIRGTLTASTDAGDLHVKAVPHDNWQLSSVSGVIRIEVPPVSGFDLDVMTESGELVIRRDDLPKPGDGVRKFIQKANGGGKRIEARSQSGRIVVS